MEAYPKDLMAGFFPLVFAVNAILKEDELSLFDTFLTAIASCLLETDVHRKRSISLFQTDDESSSDEDGIEQGRRSTARSNSGTFGFGRSGGAGGGGRTMNDISDSVHATSYAKALTSGVKGFFQTARIVTISTRYGFPPSKDPEGTANFAHELPNALKRRGTAAEKEAAVKLLFQQYPMSGIITAGWLEKHVHAVPSAIMVVCTVTGVQKTQAEQDRHLFQTIEHLQYSLVPKRQCSVQIVGLMLTDVTDAQGQEWSQAITHDLVLEDNANTPFTVTMLRASSDLEKPPAESEEQPSSEALQRLHRTARDASLLYYRKQARRTKEKLSKLGLAERKKRGPNPVELSPLMIRYCFKVAIFYEFQKKQDKSLRFLSEAYRYVRKYYLWLLENQQIVEDESEDSPNLRMSPTIGSTGEAVEVELDSSESNGIAWTKVAPAPPDDILHQCRTVADWLNLKLLSSGISSHTEGGLLAAANQWRTHSRVFASRRHSANLHMEDWFEWSYIARQRIVMSQLVDQHPPKALGDLGNNYDDVVLRCSPWRTFESAAEAMLVLGREVTKVRATDKYAMDDSSLRGDFRARYVGGVSTDGMALEFKNEATVNHREKALEFILHAISLFELELQREKRGFYADDEFSERSSSRTGARLYYLAGGILLGLGRHEEAVGHLIKATRYSQGWRELELAVRRMLIECYEKHIPSQSDATESSQNLASMILDSYFNAEMSSQDLRRALDHFAAMSGGNSLKWYHETSDEEDTSLPFSFAVSFPGKTHATSGDTVEASVVIKSNLDYAIHVKSMSLGTLVGKLPIQANDLLRAKNASEGTEGGIIIQAKSAIVVSTKQTLPKDLSAIASDESGNGGELQGVAGKGSFAKIAKPRSAGITSAGGARLVPEYMLQPGNSNSQGWNVRFLGGKPLLCDGLNLTFYPVQAEVSGSSEKTTLIELTIEKKKKRTAANIKRTPFEEENYTASAWSRPQHVPFSRGPRSLRVLGPQPELVITNLTDPIANGNALEGTVNRILLKLQAGLAERCSNLQVTVSCFSVLVTPSGSTKRLVSAEELTTEVENSIDMTNPKLRTPCLVNQALSLQKQSVATEFGYDLPPGWQTCGTGQKDSSMQVSDLKGGESSYIHLDFFRPAAYSMKEGLPTEGEIDDDHLSDVSLCKTDFYVTLTYKQERPSAKKKPTRRASRKRPVMASASKDPGSENAASEKQEEEETTDEVSLEYTGSIVWAPPISAKFRPGRSKGFPSGSRHPSNRVEDPAGDAGEVALIDGEGVSTKCSLQLDSSMEGLNTEIIAVRFEDNAETDAPFAVSLLSSAATDEPDLIYKASSDDPCRTLSPDARFGIAYTVRPALKKEFRRAGASASLGSLLVDWRPSALELPTEIGVLPCALGSSIKAHGPLALESPSTIRFTGPRCYVELAPFGARLVKSPVSPSVATPFELNYYVKNQTNEHQIVNLELTGAASRVDGGRLLLSGCTNGQLSLGPSEEQPICFTFIATRPGKAVLPVLLATSDRYKSWIINDGSSGQSIYILP